jgi:predicted AAA+ superfamily ATPase
MLINNEIQKTLKERIDEENCLIQVLLGPRQVGKTTSLQKFIKNRRKKTLYVSADENLSLSSLWINQKWNEAIDIADDTLLIIDEIQKIPNWSSQVKELWDKQAKNKKTQIKLILSGSSSLNIQKGLTESLAGRFELIRAYHWGFEESHKFFNLAFSNFILFGGYPGSYNFVTNLDRWKNYINNSIIETVIGSDILLFNTVKSPALFRQTFTLLSSYPAQVISYNKLLGQIQDRGNVDLIKYYIELFEGAFLIKTLTKYSGSIIKSKTSSPKIIPMAPALIDQRLKVTEEGRGRIFEAIVGADLIKCNLNLQYWQELNFEVDYCFEFQNKLVAIEVKSKRPRNAKSLEIFMKKFPTAIPIFITESNYESFEKDPIKFIQKFLYN